MQYIYNTTNSQVEFKITKEDLLNLLARSNKLAALERYGVEYWSEYEDACDYYLRDKFADNHSNYEGPHNYYYDFEEIAGEELNGYECI